MVLKKGTVSFNATYFKTRELANLEELLRKLPGVEVLPDGTIKVNGVTVNSVMIDGRSYFGNDTKLASKYLLSGLIDRIEVIGQLPEVADARSSVHVKQS